jgi:predicted GH43/DUF377 family glycosyl hydrolase
MDQEKRKKISAAAVAFIILVSLFALVIFEGPKWFEKEAIIKIDQVGRPLSTTAELENGTIWVQWNRYVLEPSLDNEMVGKKGNIYAPEILYEDGVYHMWYGGQSINYHDSILYATSSDGVNWTKYGTVIATGSNNHVNDPTVVKVNGTYYMYYSVAPIRELDEIWVATSNDRINWDVIGPAILPDTNIEGWDSLKVGRPSVLYQGGVFKMWFDGSQKDPSDPYSPKPGSGRHVGYAYSLNGINWTKWPSNPVFMHSGAVDVKFFDGKYVVVEESGAGVYYRFGTNETDFEQSNRLLFAKMGNDFDRYGHVTPFIFIKDGKWVATYTGAATKNTWDRNRIAVWYPQLNSSLSTMNKTNEPMSLRPWAVSPNQAVFNFTTRTTVDYSVSISNQTTIFTTKTGTIREGTINYYFNQYNGTLAKIAV